MPGVPQTLPVPPLVNEMTMLNAIRLAAGGGGGGTGTVTSVSVVTANGVSATVATATTTPALTFTLGAITPSSVNALTLAAAATGFTIAGGTSSKTLTVLNTGTAALLGIAQTFSAANIFSVNGAASTPALSLTGTLFTGGSATTTKPLFNIEPTGTTSTGWSTSGTMFGVNAASGFAGNLVDLQTNGVRMFNVTGAGVVNTGPVNGTGLNFSGIFITATASGSTTNRPSLSLAAGFGSSIQATVAGISANDGFIVSPQGGDANVNLFGGFGSFTARTFNIRPVPKDFSGAYTGAGNILALAGGTASSVTTGGAGGNLTITGGAAAGSGNNNGGDVVITGGAKTGSGTVGIVQIASGTSFRLGNAATTGLGAGVLAATTNATIVIQDSTGQAYRIPCII